jgi:hypothetical protein
MKDMGPTLKWRDSRKRDGFPGCPFSPIPTRNGLWKAHESLAIRGFAKPFRRKIDLALESGDRYDSLP